MISYHYGFMAYTLKKADGFKEYKKGYIMEISI